MPGLNRLIIFRVGNQQFAIPLENVERVIQVIEITPVPDSPDFITGIINFQGEFLPVADLRNLFQLDGKEMDLSDQLILVNTGTLKVALWVDETGEIITLPDEEIAETSKIMLDTKHVKGVFRFRNGMVLLQNIEQLLTAEEVALLKKIMDTKKVKQLLKLKRSDKRK